MTKFLGMMAVAFMLLMSWSGIAAADGHDTHIGKCESNPYPSAGEYSYGASAPVTESTCAELNGIWTPGLLLCDVVSTYIEGRGYVVWIDGAFIDCDQDDTEG